VHAITGRLDEAQEEFTQTLAVSRSTGDVLHEAFTLGFQGGFKNWAGEFEAAAAIADTALTKARDSNNLLAVTWGHFWKALPLIGKGDYDDARKTVTFSGSSPQSSSQPPPYQSSRAFKSCRRHPHCRSTHIQCL